MSEQDKNSSRGFVDQPSAPPSPPYYYGTFQGVVNSHPPPPSQPVVGYPQPVPPVGYYSHGYQNVPGYVFPDGRPYIEHRLPCCGMGIGWFLFICGFFFGTIPWYIGACLLLFVHMDYREKPGLIVCMLASVLATIAIMLGVTKATNAW
ncbi:large ribosomal subunit protein eL20z-like [Apium graveolens]|uniref:large ribosomal subunit protein eL20z-like n=1 Tax=Apium graveolens TaxID=4045 RepID=UPI003D7B9DB3